MATSMCCTDIRCKASFQANHGEILCNIPGCAAADCPVEPKRALSNKNSHLSRSATNVFDMTMPTCGNGDLCATLIHSAMNRAHVERAVDCCSFNATTMRNEKPPPNCIPKDGRNGGCITAFPPSGDWVRDKRDDASLSNNNPWGVSDHVRHTREMHGVGSKLCCAEDHAHEVTKNCHGRTRLGATALWDIGTETGEIAAAVLVRATKTTDLSNTQLFRLRSVLISNRQPSAAIVGLLKKPIG